MTIIIDATLTQERQKSGMEQYLYNLLLNLIPQSPDVKFVLALYANAKSTLDEFLQNKPANVETMHIGPMPPGFLNPLSYPFQILPAYLKAKRQYEDAIWFAPFHLRGFFPKLLPTVTVLHDLALARFNYYSNKGSLIGKLRKIEYWHHTNRVQKSDAVICPAFFTVEDFLKEFPTCPRDRVHATQLACNIEKGDESGHIKYLPQDWQRKGYLLYQGGGVQASKNSIGVLNAYNRFIELLAENKQMDIEDAPYLVISGQIFVKPSQAADEFKALISKMGLEEKVWFTGKYDDSDKWALLENAFAFIHLSLYEGFGIALLEALTVGTPAIAHNGTTYPEVAGDSALLVDGSNAQSSADAIYRIYSDNEYAKKLGEKGRERAKIFSWERCAYQTMDVFKSVYDKRYKLSK